MERGRGTREKQGKSKGRGKLGYVREKEKMVGRKRRTGQDAGKIKRNKNRKKIYMRNKKIRKREN